jgi:hypothetical protein
VEIALVGVLSIAVILGARTAFAPATSPGALAVRDTLPASGARVPARPVRVSAEVTSERDLARVFLFINTLEVEPVIEQRGPRRWLIAYQFPASRSAPQVAVKLVARDRHGREVSQEWGFQVDPTISAPSVTALQPPRDGYAPAGNARIGATVQSDAPITTATLRIGSTTYPAMIEPANADKATITARATLTPGKYDAKLTVTDRQGDSTESEWTFIVPDPKESLVFQETGKAVSGGFRRYWEERGGLSIFGLPISDEVREGAVIVQYFERARFEYHPSQDGVLSEVRLGLIGTELRRPDPPRPAPEGGNGRHFAETGHTLSGAFLRFWEERGGLALFGLPITDETREGPLTVQYFERARFELHPSSGQTVLLGQLGREVYERRYGQAATRP